MAFLTPGMATLGGSGFSLKRGSSRYLRAAAGYPCTLYATLADKPPSLTIYGNDGGVGDRTGNLFDDKKWVINAIVNDANGAIVNNQGSTWETAGTGTSYLSIANYYFAIPAGTTKLCISQDLKIWYGYRIGFYDANKSFLSCVSHLVMSSGENNVTVPDGAAYFSISRRRDHGTAAYVMINVGSTALPYEPYGYKIPILYSSKTINLYSDAQLLIGDSLTVNPETETAARGTTDLTAMQDWTQDMTLPEAEQLIVSAGTAVEPESITIEYYSKLKGDN